MKQPYDGAETLDDARGREIIMCRTPELAAWLNRFYAEGDQLAAALEAADQHRITRAELALAQLWRDRPKDLRS